MGGVILHLGLGAFHRAHQAVYTQETNRLTGDRWTIESVAMRNPALAQSLNASGGRFSVIVRHPAGPEAIEIDCLRRAYSLPDQPATIIARFADPAVSVVTVTVTEKGYCADADGVPHWDDPVVTHDLAHPGAPRGLPGLVVDGLAARRAAGLGGLTLMSCDNLAHNGALFGAAIRAFAARRDPGLAGWIARHCRFPSSMVDRITPAATPETLALARSLLGHDDPAAIETEPFRQWVIEDDFAGPRPRWELAGAILTGDVAPFEAMKLRLLNGAHSFIAYAGAILGLDAVRDVMAEADLARAVAWHMRSVARSLDPVPGFDTGGYIDALLARFANPAIAHRCLQIAMDGSQKMVPRIFAPALDLHRRGLAQDSCALVTAVWLRFVERSCAPGATLALDDPLAPALRAAVAAARGDPNLLVERIGAALGPNVAELWAYPAWQEGVARALTGIRDRGLRHAITETDPG